MILLDLWCAVCSGHVGAEAAGERVYVRCVQRSSDGRLRHLSATERQLSHNQPRRDLPRPDHDQQQPVSAFHRHHLRPAADRADERRVQPGVWNDRPRRVLPA